MLKGLFGGGKNDKDKKTAATRKGVSQPVPSAPGPTPASKPTTPAGGAGAGQRLAPQQPNQQPASVLRNSRGAGQGESMAKAAAAAASAALGQDPIVGLVGIDSASSVLEEAAVLFASGESKRAIDTLIKNLNETKGQADKPAWYMLLDAYQATDQQAPFEKLGLYFASRFGTSPPSWEPFNEPTRNDRQALGRNALTIEGSPSVLQKDKIKDFLGAAREKRSCRLDLSRMRLVEDDEQLLDGMQRVTQTMAAVRQSRFEGLLMGDAHLVEKLGARVEQSKATPLPEDEPFWMMLFEILQWRGEEERFENLAIDYAMTFEQSAPGYERDGVMSIDNSTQEDDDDSLINEQGHVVPDSVIDNQNVEPLQHAIDERLKQAGAVVINAQHVRRMDFYAAGSLARFLGKLGVEKGRVVVQGATELVVALCEITGASGFVTFQPRKR